MELVRHRAVSLRAVRKSQQQQQQFDEETNSLNSGLSSQNDQQPSHSFLTYKRFEQKRLNTVIICVVTVAFFACQFPVRIIQLIDMYVRVRNVEIMPHLVWIWLWKLSKLLFFLNFTANPVRKKNSLSFFYFFSIRLFIIFYQQNFVVHVDVYFKFIVH